MHGDQPTYQTIHNAHNNSITVLHGQNDLTMVLARFSQDIANSQDHKQDPPMWDLSVNFYICGTQT